MFLLDHSNTLVSSLSESVIFAPNVSAGVVELAQTNCRLLFYYVEFSLILILIAKALIGTYFDSMFCACETLDRIPVIVGNEGDVKEKL